MHPTDCPEFEYAHHPRRAVLQAQLVQVLVGLRSDTLDKADIASDSRAVHRKLFEELTPPGHAYYAGHYQGEEFRCLKHYSARIPSDPRVGHPPHCVPGSMAAVADQVGTDLSVLDAATEIPDARVAKEEKLLYVVVFACRVFEFFLRIHPYANGNGHAARIVVWAIFGRFGYWPRSWPVDPRSPDPPYTQLIVKYRNGNLEPLESHLLSTLVELPTSHGHPTETTPPRKPPYTRSSGPFPLAQPPLPPTSPEPTPGTSGPPISRLGLRCDVRWLATARRPSVHPVGDGPVSNGSVSELGPADGERRPGQPGPGHAPPPPPPHTDP